MEDLFAGKLMNMKHPRISIHSGHRANNKQADNQRHDSLGHLTISERNAYLVYTKRSVSVGHAYCVYRTGKLLLIYSCLC